MKPITHNGETHTLAEWAEIVGIGYRTLQTRLDSGWTITRALTEPVSVSQRKGHPWRRYNPQYMDGMRDA